MTTTLVYLTVLVMAVAGSCTDQSSEATCGAGCVWTNITGAGAGGSCGGAGAGCRGTPICAGAEDTVCSENAGCSWINASPGWCGGAAECQGQLNSDSCTAIGCDYGEVSSDSCFGSPTTCDGTTEDHCKLYGCHWTQTAVPAHCDGYLTTCEVAISEAGCNAIGFCEWKAPKPKGCYLREGAKCDDIPNLYNPSSLDEAILECDSTLGCSHSGSLGTCTGSGPITCGGGTTSVPGGACSAIDCSLNEVWRCLVPTCSHKWEAECNALGCTWASEEGCSGTPTVTSATCSSKTTDPSCVSAGCVWERPEGCLVHPYCGDIQESAGCTAAGCTWEEAGSRCSGTMTVTKEICAGKSSFDDCRAAGCTYGRIYECTGTPNVTSCSQMGTGGRDCDGVGCTSTGGSKVSCSGTIDINAGAGATDIESCEAAGFKSWYWYEGDEGGCSRSPSADPTITYKNCADFSDKGNEICYGVRCTWESAVASGCSGTPNGFNMCASLTGFGQGICEGNKCTWVPSGGNGCTGVETKTCTEQTGASACGSIGGCTYTDAVTESKCDGTNTGLCVGSTLSACTRVFGCTFSPACTVLTTADACKTGGCTWTQKGTCADEGKGKNPSSAVVIYVPVLMVLLFALLI